jgi:hypothetical protein
MEFIGLLGLLGLRVQILDKVGYHLRYKISLVVYFVKIVLYNIFLIKGDIELTLI